MRRFERIKKSPQRYIQVFGDDREWNNDAVENIVYLIQDGNLNKNVDLDDILSSLVEWDSEYCMDTPSTFQMREYYVLKYQIHDPDVSTYMEALSGENKDGYFKSMDDEIQSLMGRDTWEIVLMNSIADQNMLPRTWSFKCKRKPDRMIRKFKAQHCVRGDVHNILSTEPLISYSPVVQ